MTWFSLGRHLVLCLDAQPHGRGVNGGWANRFKFEVRHEGGAYHAGFNNPCFSMILELCGWRLAFYAEYGWLW